MMRSSISPCINVPVDLSKASGKRQFCSFTWLGDTFPLGHDELYHRSTFKVIKQQKFKWLFLLFFGIASRFVVNTAHDQVHVADLAFFFFFACSFCTLFLHCQAFLAGSQRFYKMSQLYMECLHQNEIHRGKLLESIETKFCICWFLIWP